MTANDFIERLMNPRSIAILGCSEGNAGGLTLRNLLDNEYPGTIYPVHPRKTEVHGVETYPDLASIPGQVDCCVVAVRHDRVLDAVDQLHANGIHAALIYASGFAEVGEAGISMQRELSRRLEEYEIAACGPNCLGLANFAQHAPMYYAGLDVRDKGGPIGFVSHSGSSCIALTNSERGTGYSYVISCGNESGISVPDYIRFLTKHDGTEIIALHLEAVRNPDDLAEAAKLALAENKPIVVLKLGRSERGQQTAAAHSGALASPQAITEAYFARHGMILVESLDELQETCELLLGLKRKLPTAGSVAITAVSGGMAGLSADIGTEEGVDIADLSEETIVQLRDILPPYATPANPLDVTTALHEPDTYRRCLEILDADPAVGLIVVCQGAEPGLNQQQRELYAPIAQMMADLSNSISTPIASFSPIGGGLEPAFNSILRRADVPQLKGAVASMRAIRHLMEWAQYKNRGPAPEVGGAPQPLPLVGDGTTLSERESKQLLSSYGIPVARDILVSNIDEAVSAANSIGLPVVMKVDSPDITHKTEAGAVAIGVQTPQDVAEQYEKLLANALSYDRTARINGISVQEMVRPGIEVVLGIKNDPTFGPAVLVGLGGVYTEVFDDVSLRLAPIEPDDAWQMLAELRCARMLDEFRGSRAADKAALIEAICAVSRMAVDYKYDISEMDVNPLVVFEAGQGVKALDALIVRTPSPELPARSDLQQAFATAKEPQ